MMPSISTCLHALQLFALLGMHEFLPSEALVAYLEGGLCRYQPGVCLNILSALAGYRAGNIDAERLPLYLRYTPAGTSVQNIAHWCQAVRERLPRTLRHFDYGTDCAIRRERTIRCNQISYGRDVPPEYDLGSIKGIDIMLVTGLYDIMLVTGL